MNDVGTSTRNALDTVLDFLPRLVLFLVILAIGYFIAKALEKVLVKVLDRVGFERAVERGGIKKMLSGSQYDAGQILARIVFYAVMLFVLSTAFGVFGTNPISTYLSAVIGYLPRVFVAILILVIAAAIAAAVKLLVQNSLGSLSYARVLANAASTVILALAVIAALDQLQIAQNVVNAVLYAALAALVGIVVVAVGGGGIAPMRQRWEKVLDKVESEAPSARREVQRCGTRDDALHGVTRGGPGASRAPRLPTSPACTSPPACVPATPTARRTSPPACSGPAPPSWSPSPGSTRPPPPSPSGPTAGPSPRSPCCWRCGAGAATPTAPTGSGCSPSSLRWVRC